MNLMSVKSGQKTLIFCGDSSLIVELLLLCSAAPFIYVSERFPVWTQYIALFLLIMTWVWRHYRLGIWIYPTPAKWPIFFLFFIMLPISVLVAPPTLRQEYSIPRTMVMIWNFCLFWTILTYGSCNSSRYNLYVILFLLAGIAVMGVALLGTEWRFKMPGLPTLLSILPRPLLGVFQGASNGLNPNQVAGTLLYFLPLYAAVIAREVLYKRRWYFFLPGCLLFLISIFVLVATQSRTAYAGFIVSLFVMGLMPFRFGRWLLVMSVSVAILIVLFLPIGELLSQTADATTIHSSTGAASLVGRQEIWTRAIYGIQDFAFTGMGFGTFRKIVHLLYPGFLVIPAGEDFGHAHNFFLQNGVDFGLPGLISVLAFYFLALFQCIYIGLKSNIASYKIYSLGLLGAIAGQTTFSLLDAVAMGSKTNFLFWFLFALVFSLRKL